MQTDSHTTGSPLRQFTVLLILFIGLRLTVLIAHEPGGLLAYGEFDNFRKFAEITQETGLLPYIGYWMEYPPIFVWFNLAVHQFLVVFRGLPDQAYYYALALVVVAFDAGNLVLMRRIGEKLYSPDRGLDIAWVYAVLGVPLVFMLWNLEVVVMFWMLLAVWNFLIAKDVSSSVAASIGALIKIFPGFIVPVYWRFRPVKRSMMLTLIMTACGALAYLPFFVISPRFAWASLTALAGKSSWQSVWGLIDGNLTTGNFGALAERLDPLLASRMVGNPPVIPGYATLVVFAGIYLYMFTRPVRRDNRAVVAFLGMTWCVFLLWSKGWSTPWMQMLIPLLLLVFPDRTGILALMLFTLVNFAEWPFFLSRGMFWTLYITAPLRTILVTGFLVAFYRVFRLDHSLSEGEVLAA